MNKIVIKTIQQVLRTIFLLFIACISVLPLLWTFLSSLKTDKEILTSAFSLPEVWMISNYVEVIRDTPIVQFYGNSVIIAISTTLLAVLVYGLSAYVLARCKFFGKTLIFNLFSISILVPMTAILLPVYLVITNIGLYNTKYGLILVYLALAMPVTLFIMRSYFQTIPYELEESAYIDGASFTYTYFRIIFPIATPGFSSAAVLAFLLAWNDFMYAFVLTESNSVRTLPISLKYLFDAYSSNYAQFFAAVCIIVIPTILVYVVLQKHIERGLVAGSVKG